MAPTQLEPVCVSPASQLNAENLSFLDKKLEPKLEFRLAFVLRNELLLNVLLLFS